MERPASRQMLPIGLFFVLRSVGRLTLASRWNAVGSWPFLAGEFRMLRRTAQYEQIQFEK